MGCVTSCFTNDVKRIDYDIIKQTTTRSFYSKLRSDKQFRKIILNSKDSSDRNCLIYICQNNLSILDTILSYITKEQLLYRDNSNASFLHYLMANKDTNAVHIDMIYKNKKFHKYRHEIESYTDDEGNTFLIIAAICKRYDLIDYLNLNHIKHIIKKVNVHGDSLLSLSLTEKQENIIIHIIRSLKFKKYMMSAPKPYINIVHMLLLYNEPNIITFMKRNGVIFASVAYYQYDVCQKTGRSLDLFSLACKLKKGKFIQDYISQGYLSNNNIQHNIIFLSTMLQPHTILRAIQQNMRLLDSFNDTGNNLLLHNILHKTPLVNILLNGGYINNKTIKWTNKYGNNALIHACIIKDFDLLHKMYNMYKENYEFIFKKNNDDQDFIDILMDTNDSFIFGIMDTSLYDVHDNIIKKYYQGFQLTTDENIYIRYQIKEYKTNNETKIDENNECSICLNDFTQVRFDCTHELCFKCSLSMYECPICRGAIKTKDLFILST